MRGNAKEHIRESRLRINAIHFRRLCRAPNYAERAWFPQSWL
jgi:hypothetical protein